MYKYADMVYKGQRLIEYCKMNNYDYDNVYLRLKYIFKSNRFKRLTKRQKIDLAIERYKERDNYKYSSYIYNGKRLREYCKDNNIPMQYMYSRLIAYEKSNRKRFLPLDIKIQMAINCFKGINDNRYANIIYKGKKLSLYCKENGIKYYSIRNKICYEKRKGYIEDLPNEERISAYIASYNRLEKIKNIKKNMNLLKSEESDDINYELISSELNINYNELIKLSDSTLSVRKLIILSWYSGDMEDSNGVFISKNKLQFLKTGKDLDINDLVALFKSGNKESLIDIIEFEKYYLMGIIKRQLNKYDLVLTKCQYKDLIESMRFQLINSINESVMAKPSQIVKYIDIVIAYKTLNYLIENIFNKPYTYIDEIRQKSNSSDYTIY